MLNRNIIFISIAVAIVVIGIVAISFKPFPNIEPVTFSIVNRTATIQIDDETIQANGENWLPVSISEKIVVSGPIDSIEVLRILPHRAIPRQDEGPLLQLTPLNPSKSHFEIIDQNQNDIIDHSDYPGPYSRGGQFRINAKCAGVDREAYFHAPEQVPLIPFNTSIIFTRYSDHAIQPDQDGVYHLNFWSFYEPEIKLPSDAILISTNKEFCSVFYEDFEHIFYYNIEFRK
jgi:hypothetical protein